MIFYWLFRFICKVEWLLKFPVARDVARVKKNAACPVCGSKHGILRAVERIGAQGDGQGRPVTVILCQHTCQTCGARWWEGPVVKVTPQLVWPSVPRTEFEKIEDLQRSLRAAQPQQQQRTQ